MKHSPKVISVPENGRKCNKTIGFCIHLPELDHIQVWRGGFDFDPVYTFLYMNIVILRFDRVKQKCYISAIYYIAGRLTGGGTFTSAVKHKICFYYVYAKRTILAPKTPTPSLEG